MLNVGLWLVSWMHSTFDSLSSTLQVTLYNSSTEKPLNRLSYIVECLGAAFHFDFLSDNSRNCIQRIPTGLVTSCTSHTPVMPVTCQFSHYIPIRIENEPLKVVISWYYYDALKKQFLRHRFNLARLTHVIHTFNIASRTHNTHTCR